MMKQQLQIMDVRWVAFLDWRAEFLFAILNHPRPAAAMMVYQAILRPCLSRLPRNASIDKAVQAINEAVAATGSMKPLTLFETCRQQVIMPAWEEICASCKHVGMVLCPKREAGPRQDVDDK